MRFDGVLFDLDGTLLATLQDLGDSVNRVLAARGWPTHSLEAYRYFVGEGASTLIERAMPEEHRDAASVRGTLAAYRADYEHNWNNTTKPYDGIPDMLAEMRRRGLVLGVLSNKPHAMTVRCIESYFPDVPFPALLGQRDEVAKKPDPAGAYEAARLMGVASARVLYVGDTGTDMQTARAAGMFALGVTWGFRPAAELLENGAQALAHHPREVIALLDGSA
jgi:phosphoglycolate phosphatase